MIAKKFTELTAKMSPQSIQRSDEQVKAMLAEMPLFELRRARGLSQQALADILQVQQPAIAKLERRADMYISTLRSHIEAMGGELDIVARFPEGEVKINNFSEMNSSAMSIAEPKAEYQAKPESRK